MHRLEEIRALHAALRDAQADNDDLRARLWANDPPPGGAVWNAVVWVGAVVALIRERVPEIRVPDAPP